MKTEEDIICITVYWLWLIIPFIYSSVGRLALRLWRIVSHFFACLASFVRWKDRSWTVFNVPITELELIHVSFAITVSILTSLTTVFLTFSILCLKPLRELHGFQQDHSSMEMTTTSRYLRLKPSITKHVYHAHWNLVLYSSSIVFVQALTTNAAIQIKRGNREDRTGKLHVVVF